MKLDPSTNIDFKELENSRSYKVFKKSIKSVKTLYQYNYYLREFLRYTNFTSYDEICKSDRIQELLENWIMDLSDKGIKGNSIRAKLAAVELLLEMNRIIFYKKILHKLIPKDNAVRGGDIPFTNDEIKQMLDSTKKLRTKALVHFIASTGIRPGALVDPILRKKHLVEMPHDCLAIKVYDQSSEGYWAFLTPEAKKPLMQYLNARKRNGEEITDESPLFANEEGQRKGQYLNYNNLKTMMMNIMKNSGVVRTKTGYRYDKALTYGFRKRFNGILKMNNEINSNIAEKLMAHKRGLDGNYLKPTREECFAEFCKAVSALTVSDEERLRVETQQKQQEIEELAKKNPKVEELVKRIEALEYGSEARQTELVQLVHAIEQRTKTKEYEKILAQLGKALHEDDSQDEDKPSMLEALVRIWFELRAPEGQKREIWKKLKNLKEGETMSMSDFGPSNGLRVKNFYDDGSDDDPDHKSMGEQDVSSLAGSSGRLSGLHS